MDQLLTLSRAAKLAGVKRKDIQQKIKAGELETFEGAVKTTALIQVYPNIQLEDSRHIERMMQIREDSISKMGRVDAEISEINQLKIELAMVKAEATLYKQVISEFSTKIAIMEKECDHKQKAALQALLGFIMTKMKQGER